jgi:predicted PurR-regulated permease PerM
MRELIELLGFLSGEKSPLPDLFDRLRALAESFGLGSVLPEGNDELLLPSLARLLSSLGSVFGSALGHLPSILFFLLSSSIAAVYLVLWLPKAREHLPPSISLWLSRGREVLWRGVSVYARAYAILFAVTVGTSLVGLALLRAPYPLLLSLLLGAVDLLPVLGVGTVLIPWAVFSFFVGRFGFGLGLALLWLAVTVVRRILEDRLVGRGFGVHPLLILLAVCIGLHFFGFLGLFLGPIAIAVGAAVFKRQEGEG